MTYSGFANIRSCLHEDQISTANIVDQQHLSMSLPDKPHLGLWPGIPHIQFVTPSVDLLSSVNGPVAGSGLFRSHVKFSRAF